MTTIEEEMIALGVQHLKSAIEVLQTRWVQTNAKKKKKEDDWHNLLMRIDKYPNEYLILEARRDIEEMWDKCLKGTEEKERLKAAWPNHFSDEVLNNHLAELQQLNDFYNTNKHLIDMIHHYDNMWDCLSNVEKQLSDPERLFKNRGAQLLKEEHDRKATTKLPKMENAILRLLEKRKNEKKEIFYVRGEDFSDLVNRRWQKHKENKNLKRSNVLIQKPLSAGPDSKRRKKEFLNTRENGIHSPKVKPMASRNLNLCA